MPTLRVEDHVPKAVALAFLKAERRENVFLIERIHKAGMDDTRDPTHGAFLGVFDQSQSLRGLCFLGNTGTLVLSVDDKAVADLLARTVFDLGRKFTLAVGEDEAMKAFVQRWTKLGGVKPVLNRRQPFYVLDAKSIVRSIKEIDMEQASLDSIDELTVLACDMVCEDLKLKAHEVDRRKYRLRMTERIVDGRAFMCRDDEGRVVFKCDLGVVGPNGALLEGVYTPKPLRKKGVATRALGTLCKDMLLNQDVPFVVLHVDERNKSARAAYEKIGFQHSKDFRLVLMPTNAA